jgi:protein tyrosine/serine phosphatase
MLVVIIGSGLALGLWQTRFPKRFAVVEPGVLYRSAQPKTGHIKRLAEEYGIKTLLIVREGSSRKVPDEKEYAETHGLNVVQIPIISRAEIPQDQIEQFFSCVDDPAQQPVLVHCSAGRHRTGYLCALYRIERQGWEVSRAIEEMLSFGFNTDSQHAVLTQIKQYQSRAKNSSREPLATSGATSSRGRS